MSQLIDQINEFTTNVRGLPQAQQDKFYAALRAAVGPVKSSRQLGGGRVAETRDVDLEGLLTQPDVVPSDLRQDYRELCKAIATDAKKRGASWAGEALPLIVKNRLLPQPTPGQQLLDSTPGLLEAIMAGMKQQANAKLSATPAAPPAAPPASPPSAPSSQGS